MISRRPLRSERGIALVMAIMILLVLAILIPSIVFLTQKETKDTVASDKKTVTFQLAEAGQDRAAWKLRESDQIWSDAASGTSVPAGYNDDVVYTDVAGGEYKIKISSGPGTGEVTVLAKGRATGQTDIRAIKAVYGKGNSIGAMSVNGALQYKPNLTIEWGPVITYSSITQTPANYYPRKYSAGAITGRDTVNDSMNGAMPSGNWAQYDYASFYDLGTAPTINLSYYLNLAKNSQVPLLAKGSGSGNASPWTSGGFNSGYYPATAQGGSTGNSNGVKMQKGTGSGNYYFASSTSVIYVEGDVQRWPSGTWVDDEAVIVTGNSDFNGGGNAYDATVPVAAQDEYRYVPDGVNYWASKGWTAGATTHLTDVGMHGFLYVGGNVSNAGGGATMVGAIMVNGAVTTNTMTVYYDAAVTSNIKLSNAPIQRYSWDEVRVSSW